MKEKKNDAKRVFLKKGACSHAFFYLLNREFGHFNEEAEKASDPLAGGMAQEGYQCGMLWGSALSIGAESYRKNNDLNRGVAQAISGVRHLLDSFIEITKSANCSVITNCDFNSKFGLVKFMLSGKPLICFNLAEKWAPEAILAAKKGMEELPADLPANSISCASEVVRMMGGTDEEMVMVAGFAGGLGLSGNACGALSAAIWYKTLVRVREGSYKFVLNDPVSEKIKEKFLENTSYKMECSKICGKQFNSINEYSEFVRSGGCSNIITLLGSL